VGTGKTVEAGLILAELLARGRVKRFLIVTPANLREQWQHALDYFFHIETKILSSQARRQYERELPAGANPWQYFDRVIVSIDYAKDPETKLKIIEQQWDLLLVDEAHNAAKPHQQAADQTIDMDRWLFVKDLADTIPNLLLLTATPHNGYTDSFASLIQMLDPQFVSGETHKPTINRRLARFHVCQRSRRDIEKWYDQEGLKCPFARHDQRDHKEEIIPIHKDLKSILIEVEKHCEFLLQNARENRRAYTSMEWVALHLQKRALSSPAALRESLKNRMDEVNRRLAELKDFDEQPAEPSLLKNNVLDRDTGERAAPEEATRRTDRALYGDEKSFHTELRALVRILELAKAFSPAKDSKLQFLLTKVLPQLLRRAPKVIIFTRYHDTLDYLVEQLAKSKIVAAKQVFALHGDLSEAARREEFRKFERADKAVLVATDVISEGVNLQHACSQIVHYELPWNPNRLEQRNGRVDRFGQQAPEVTIRTLVMDETIDVAILELLIKKAVKIRDDRGFCPPYFGDEVNLAHMIRSHKREARQQTLSGLFDDPLEEALQRRISDPYSDENVDRVVEDSFYGEADVSLPDVTARLKRSYDLVGSPEQVERFVRSALSCYHCAVKTEADDSLTISIPEPRLQLPGIGSKLQNATFSPEAALADPDLVVLDIGHPLVRRLINIVREDFFQAGANNGRTSAMVTDAVQHVTVLCHYLVRYIVGRDSHSVVEEMIPAAFRVYDDHVCSHDEIAALLAARPKPRNPLADETQEHFGKAAASASAAKALAAAIRRHTDEMLHERRELKSKLQQETNAHAAVREWLDGIDKLEVASQELLTATLYLPR